MAQTLEQARKLSRTSIHGRRLGLDHDEFLVGVKGTRHVVTDATSLTTSIPNHGYVSLNSSNAHTWTLADPEAGCEVKLVITSSSTKAMTITPAAATFISSASSTSATLTLLHGGNGLTLIGLTTGLYGCANNNYGSTNYDFST